MSSFEHNQARGFKAALSNPQVSDEAKQNAQERLNEIGHRGTDEITQSVRQGKDESHVIAGYKAALNNPNVSNEARQHAEQVLDSHTLGHTQPQVGGQRTHEDNVLRGYKAALHNPRVSEEAKERAGEYLERNNAL